MQQPSSAIDAALRAELPPHLHYLIEPLKRYLEALQAVGDMTSHPAIRAALGRAFASMEGASVALSSGQINFGTGSNLGDLTIRDVAGRDIVHINLVLPPSTPSQQPPPAMSSFQIELLVLINELLHSNAYENISLQLLAELSNSKQAEVDNALRSLSQMHPDLLHWESRWGRSQFQITTEGSRIARLFVANAHL